MSKSKQTTQFLKECMADALLRIMEEKEFRKITVDEIVKIANVGRATWFRNFSSKESALTFKLVSLWEQWTEANHVIVRDEYFSDNVPTFFHFNASIQPILRTLYRNGLQN